MSATTHPLSPRQRSLTLGVVALGVFVTALDNSIVNVALPSIQRDLHLGARRRRVDRQRLHPGLRDAAANRRAPRRRLRAPAHLPHRRRQLHRRFGSAAGLAQTATELISRRASSRASAPRCSPRPRWRSSTTPSASRRRAVRRSASGAPSRLLGSRSGRSRAA